MNKEKIEKEDRGISISMPLLTQEEINGIDINMDEMINQFTKMLVKEKDLVIAQHIIKRQQEKIEKLEQKESILDKVTDKLKEDINRFDKVIKDRGIWGEQKVDFKKYKNYAINLLNIIEGEKK